MNDMTSEILLTVLFFDFFGIYVQPVKPNCFPLSLKLQWNEIITIYINKLPYV